MLPIFDWYSVMDIVHATYSYTFTGTKLARPWSIGSSHIHVCNNHCRARFLRAINSSSPHSWVPLSLSPSECNVVAMQRDRSTPCGECGRAWFEKRQGKKLQSFGLFLPKGTWLHVLDPSHDLSRLHLFFLYISIFCCSFNLHKTLQSGMHMIINSLLGQVRNLNFTERSVMFKFPQKNYD
jgi:hypothetical protein